MTRLCVLLLLLGGCIRAPSPLTPGFRGSIGAPSKGILTDSEELPRSAPGLQWLRPNDRHHGTKTLVGALTRAAERVAAERRDSIMLVGDLSARGGGPLSGHLSHRTGRDADLLLYMTTLDGAALSSPGFVAFGADGLASLGGRYVRFDVERQWLLIKHLLEDPEARVQWIFVADILKAMLLSWATARGDTAETLYRASLVLHEPRPPAEPHADHLHVRVACTEEELACGCELGGPERPWLRPRDRTVPLSEILASLSEDEGTEPGSTTTVGHTEP